MRTVADLQGLITPWHAGRAPKFVATVGAVVAPLVDLQAMVAHLPEDFDLDEAIGAQLDVVGEWIGRSRYILTPLPDIWFSFDDAIRGFDQGIWYGPYDVGSGVTKLDDDTYRALLKTKILCNAWDGTSPSAAAILETFFGPRRDPNTLIFVQQNDDMSLTFGVSGTVPSLLLLSLLSKGYVPLKPAGVKTYYSVTSVNYKPLFGFDVQNQYVSGFDTGAWGVSPDYLADHPV